MKTIKLTIWNERPYNYTGIIEWSNGTKHWCLNGEYHRENGPAIEFAGGNKCWYLDGKHYLEDKYRIEMMIRNCTLGRLILNGDYFTIKEGKLK